MPKQMKKDIRKTNLMKLVERTYNKDIIELLKEMYTDEHMSIQQISNEIGVSTCSIQQWLILFDIPRRHITFI